MKRNMKSRLLLLFIFAIYVIGGSFLAYPTVSDMYVRYAAEYEIDSYSNKIQETSEEDLQKMEQEAKEYNANLASEQGILTVDNTVDGTEDEIPSFDSLVDNTEDEIPSFDSIADDAEDEILSFDSLTDDTEENSRKDGSDAKEIPSYDKMLHVTEAIGYLEIPKIDIYLPIYHGLDEEVLERGIGHMPESSLPVGGSSTHCVLSGHTGLPSAKLLTKLDNMEKGDMFYIHTLNKTLAYEVDQIKVVLPEETDDIKIVTGKDYVTVLTCTPYGINTHRLLVRGVRTKYNPPEEEVAEEVPQQSGKLKPETVRLIFIISYAGVIVIVTLLILFLPGKKSKRRKG